MTIDKAIEQTIEHMQERIRAYTETITPTSSEQKREKMQRRIAECELAIQALREQQKRQSGCVWCKENGMVTHNGQHYELFCSYCGRRLEVEGKVNE